MARVITKIGDIFEAHINESTKRYFQYIANDITQLNSDVIRAFKSSYVVNEEPTLESIINDQVDFYAHCTVNIGVKLGFWEKIGKSLEIGDISIILFRDTNDCGHKTGEKPIIISDKWYVWRINDKDFTRVGKLEGEYRKAEIGVVLNPYDIIDRIRTGKYNFVYPGFE